MPYIKHRKVLVDWMGSLCERLRMKHHTFVKSIGILDLFATHPDIFISLSKRDFNLIGITCLMIASKLEETLRPRLVEFM